MVTMRHAVMSCLPQTQKYKHTNTNTQYEHTHTSTQTDTSTQTQRQGHRGFRRGIVTMRYAVMPPTNAKKIKHKHTHKQTAIQTQKCKFMDTESVEW